MKTILQAFIKFYQFFLSPFMGNQCRFTPTCSHYASKAIDKHGALKGAYLGFTRICNCHSFSKRPFEDNVPKRFAWRDALHYKDED